MSRRPLSVRARIVSGSTLVVLLLVITACVAVYAQISALAFSREKAVLHGIAEVYHGIIVDDPAEPFETPGIGQHVAILAPDGAVRMNTLPAQLRNRLPELTSPGPALREADADQTYLVYVEAVSTPEGTWTIVVTRNSDIAAGVVSQTQWLLWTLVVGSAVLFAAGAWVVATAALRPVERLRQSAASLAHDRHNLTLLPVTGSGDEIDSLAGTLNQLISEVRSASAREQQMVADASHELRNPLAVLHAQLELVEGSGGAADQTLLREARETLARLIHLSQSLLELSRVDAQEHTEATSLSALSTELAERVDQMRWRVLDPASTLRGSLTVDKQVESPQRTVRLDKSGFAHLVDNLLDNALRSSQGRAVHVRVNLVEHATEVVLTVSDDGRGFDPAILDRAFERFTRGGNSHYAGGGLGLAIVSRLVELAGGSAHISSPPSGGATVAIRLPLT